MHHRGAGLGHRPSACPKANRIHAQTYVFAGLPGAGKSTLSNALAKRIGAVYLLVDTVEQALRDLCELDVQGEGYRISYRIAEDNLRIGMSVVADSCNPLELTRREWERVAARAGCDFCNIEIVCGDPWEHRDRVESRTSQIPGLKPPTWSEVSEREYEDWSSERIRVDTAGRGEVECLEELMRALQGR
jgi:predicted kinase